MNPIRKMNWDALVHEYDLDAKRLLPWEGLVAPFGGAWCVVRPKTRSRPHAHDERELFICMRGEAKVSLRGEFTPVAAGDIIVIPPDTHHFIANEGEADFHFYSIWWDRESAQKFVTESEAIAP